MGRCIGARFEVDGLGEFFSRLHTADADDPVVELQKSWTIAQRGDFGTAVHLFQLPLHLPGLEVVRSYLVRLVGDQKDPLIARERELTGLAPPRSANERAVSRVQTDAA